MFIIRTKFLGPTDTRGVCIRATLLVPGYKANTVDFDYASCFEEGCRAAAEAAVRQNGVDWQVSEAPVGAYKDGLLWVAFEKPGGNSTLAI